jgi:hypothetical protein
MSVDGLSLGTPRGGKSGLRTNALVAAGAGMFVMLSALATRPLGGPPLLLRSLKSDDVEHTDKVEVQAILNHAPISLSRTFLVAALKASMKVVRRHIPLEENKRLNPTGFHRYDTILVLECP